MWVAAVNIHFPDFSRIVVRVAGNGHQNAPGIRRKMRPENLAMSVPDLFYIRSVALDDEKGIQISVGNQAAIRRPAGAASHLISQPPRGASEDRYSPERASAGNIIDILLQSQQLRCVRRNI